MRAKGKPVQSLGHDNWIFQECPSTQLSENFQYTFHVSFSESSSEETDEFIIQTSCKKSVVYFLRQLSYLFSTWFDSTSVQLNQVKKFPANFIHSSNKSDGNESRRNMIFITVLATRFLKNLVEKLKGLFLAQKSRYSRLSI